MNHYVDVVDRAWSGEPSQRIHLPEYSPPDAKCPSQGEIPIACRCSAWNKQRVYNKKSSTGGITVLVTASAGIGSYSQKVHKRSAAATSWARCTVGKVRSSRALPSDTTAAVHKFLHVPLVH